MRVCGVDVCESSGEDLLSLIRLEKIGFVFQTFNLLSSMSAQENVELPMTLKSELSVRKRRQRARMSLERVGLGHRLHHYPSMLSGGGMFLVVLLYSDVA